MAKDCNSHQYTIKVFKFLLTGYKLLISPILHLSIFNIIGGGCRFYPSCSEYTEQALNKYGISFKTLNLVVSRILRCQPIKFNKKSKDNYGYDPVN